MGLLDGTNQQEYYTGNDFGGYQFVSLEDIINQFMIIYVGEDKLISRARRLDVAFHAQRALAELSFDTFKCTKSQEITLPSSLTMMLPQDYVNYISLSWLDDSGIQHTLYPTSKTSNPTPILQNGDGDYAFTAVCTLVDGSSSITLDSEYNNVLVGMVVSSPNIPVESIVASTANASGITTITITDANGTDALATYSGDETLTFTPQDDSLIIEEESAFILENVTWSVNEDKITQSPNTGVSDIKVGMLVSHKDFPQGTTVVDVNGAVITTSSTATLASTSTTNEVTFVSANGNSTTWNTYKGATPAENQKDDFNYDDDNYDLNIGQRYGIHPQHAQINGSFYIDEIRGKINFSSNISGKNVILKYISDSLGTDAQMKVHKFAEDAMYKHILCDIMSARRGVPFGALRQYKKDKFAAVRKAKLRLSNIKIEEITQILRGKSKWIKH